MSFLAVWALAALALVAVPLAIHFRRKRAGRRVAFPSLRYLKQAGDATARSLRTRDLLLLAVRVALLASLVGAAAGPLVGRGGVADHPPSDIAVILDNSASTGRIVGDVTLLDRLIDRTRQVLAAGRVEDRFWIFPAVGPPLAAAASVPRAADALDRVEQTDGTADLRAIVERAAASLPRDADRHRELLLLSDLQATAFASAGESGQAGVEDAPSPVAGLAVNVYSPGELPADNAAVGSLSLSQGLVAPAGVRQTVFFELADLAAAVEGPDSLTVPVRLRVDGRTAGATRIPPAGSGAMRLPELEPGPHFGGIEIEPSGLRADDTRHFALVTPPPQTVVHAGPNDGFVRIALETLRGAGRLGGLDGPGGGSAIGRVAVVEEARRVRAADLGSTVVLLPPADPVELPALNQLLRELQLQWRARPDTLPGELTLDAGTEGMLDLGEVRVRWRYRLEGVTTSDSVWLRTGDGEPWLVSGRAGDRTYALLASPLLPDASTLPASPAMLPFMETLLLRVSAGHGWPVADLEAGRSIPLPPWVDSIGLPDGEARQVEGGAPFVPNRASVYELRGNGQRIFLAANVPALESDLSPLSFDEVEELFPGANVTIAGPGERAWQRTIYRDRRGVDIAPWLLVVAIVLAVVESGLAAPRRAPLGGNH